MSIDFDKMNLMRKLLCLVSLFLLCACSGVPSLNRVFSMSEEDAKKKLSDIDQETIRENWGEPSSFFSGLYGDIYEDPQNKDRLIGVVYDHDSKKVISVVFFDRQK